MRSITKYFLIISGLLVFQNAFSQKNYLEGYIVNIEEDSIAGYIDYRDWENTPTVIEFRESLDADPVAIHPEDILEFGVKDERFVSTIVKSIISSDNLDELDFEFALKTSIDTVFLEAVLIGEPSLYYLRNELGNECFYIQQETEFILLEYKRYFAFEDGKKVLKENTKYLGQLSYYLKDLESIQAKLASTKYNTTSLARLFNYYHDSSGKTFNYVKRKRSIELDFGILAGLSITSIKFKGEGPSSLKKSDFGKSFNFSPGVSLDIILPKNQGKWSFNNELIMTSFATDGYYADFENENIYSNYTTILKYSYLKLNNMVRFRYPLKNIFIYVNAGISNGMVLGGVNQKTQETKFYNTETTKIEEALSFTRNHEQGLLFGLGMKFKKYSLETRYELGNGMSNYTQLSSMTNRLYFYLGYSF
jgi:hypothetical protein